LVHLVGDEGDERKCVEEREERRGEGGRLREIDRRKKKSM
jgi:hypothetical protein